MAFGKTFPKKNKTRKPFGHKGKHAKSDVSPVKRVTEWANEINTAWHKSIENIFKVARLCAEASEQLEKPDKDALLEALQFDKSTFSKLVKIGNNPDLQEFGEHLPPNYSVIYEVSGLDRKALKTAITKGAIHPAVTRAEVKLLAKPTIQKEADNQPGGRGEDSSDQDNDDDDGNDQDQADFNQQSHQQENDEHADAQQTDDQAVNDQADDDESEADQQFAALSAGWKTSMKRLWEKASWGVRERFVRDVLGYHRGVARKAS